jgi:hypothetical protein
VKSSGLNDINPLKMAGRLNAGIQLALGKVYLLLAPLAEVLFVEFIGKDFGFSAAVGTLADKGFQVFELLITGTMLRCRHVRLLSLPSFSLHPPRKRRSGCVRKGLP